VTWQWRQSVANLAKADAAALEARTNLGVAEAANRKAQARFELAMDAVRAFTSGASEDVILKERVLEGLRRKLLGQSQVFYEKIRALLEGETDWPSRAALADALFDAGVLYGKVDAPQKAVQAHQEALVLREGLLREQPRDPATRRDIGRSHLALAEILDSQARVDEARAAVARARSVLEPLVRERPDDGGARRLEAECDSLEGSFLGNAGRYLEGQTLLARSRALYEALIRDEPKYTLPTAANGPTEYRRGLAEVVVKLANSYFHEAKHDEALKVWEKQVGVLEELAAGPFADDADRRRLGIGYHRSGWVLLHLGRYGEAILACERGEKIFQRLADANPTVASYKTDLAGCLNIKSRAYGEMGDLANSRRYSLRALSALQTLTPDQRGVWASVYQEADIERGLAVCDLGLGRLDSAARHIERSLAVSEAAAVGHHEYHRFQDIIGVGLRNLALIELISGRAEGALRAARRLSAHVEPVLRDHPDLRFVQEYQISGLLIEALIHLKAGRASEAARITDRAARVVEGLKPPFSPTDRMHRAVVHGLFHVMGRTPQERFYRAAVHGLSSMLGRPAGPGLSIAGLLMEALIHLAEPPGLRQHADRAVAEMLEADRMGFRSPSLTAIIAQLVPGRPEIRLLLMDQLFPADPFEPLDTAKDGTDATP
jgi:tetratricopeptide (TPR) repeat protein